MIHDPARSPVWLYCFIYPCHLFLYSLNSFICVPLMLFSDNVFLCFCHMLLAWVSFTPCVFCPCILYSFLRTSVALFLFLETSCFLHFPLLIHPSAQEIQGVFPVFWLLYWADCLQSVLIPLTASPVIWGHCRVPLQEALFACGVWINLWTEILMHQEFISIVSFGDIGHSSLHVIPWPPK